MSETEASWLPDPDGRHQYRWFDGTSWTDQVSDDGVVTTDPPGPAGVEAAAEPAGEAPVTEPTPAAEPPVAEPSPWAAANEPTTSMPAAGGPPPPASAAPAASGGGGGNKVPLIIGGVAIAALLGAAAFFFLGGDDDGLSSTERAELVSMLSEEGLTEAQANCIIDSLVDDLGVDEMRDLAANPDTEPTATQMSAVLSAYQSCEIDMFGMGDTTDTTGTTGDTTDDTTAGTGSIPGPMLDAIVQGMLADSNLTETQARCFAERLFAMESFDLSGLMADPDSFDEQFGSDPSMVFGIFEIFEACDIPLDALDGAGGFGDLGDLGGGTSSGGSSYGDDPALDALWDACAAGDGEACDDLYFQSPIGSEYEEFGDTCGGRFPPGAVFCANEL